MRSKFHWLLFSFLALAGLTGLARADDPLYTWESQRVLPYYDFPVYIQGTGTRYAWRDTFAWHLNNTGQTNRSWMSATSTFPGGPGTVDKAWDHGDYDLNILPLWEISEESTNVVIAICDSGIDNNLEDFDEIRTNTVAIGSFSNGVYSSTANDVGGHGTSIAGIIGSDRDTVGIKGIVKGAKYILEDNQQQHLCSNQSSTERR